MLLDFAIECIDNHNINEFRLIMDLNDKKIFIIPYKYHSSSSKNRRQASNAGGNNLIQKLKNILANRSSTFEFLYYISCYGINEDNIWMGGVWSRDQNNKINIADPDLKIIVTTFDNETKNSSSTDPKFKKDIMEMWFDWNDAQKHNYCYGILRALRSMGLKKSPGLYLKWNRGIENGNQSEKLNHFHIILKNLKNDLEKLYNHRQKLISSGLLPKKGLSSLDTRLFFSANEKDFI